MKNTMAMFIALSLIPFCIAGATDHPDTNEAKKQFIAQLTHGQNYRAEYAKKEDESIKQKSNELKQKQQYLEQTKVNNPDINVTKQEKDLHDLFADNERAASINVHYHLFVNGLTNSLNWYTNNEWNLEDAADISIKNAYDDCLQSERGNVNSCKNIQKKLLEEIQRLLITERVKLASPALTQAFGEAVTEKKLAEEKYKKARLAHRDAANKNEEERVRIAQDLNNISSVYEYWKCKKSALEEVNEASKKSYYGDHIENMTQKLSRILFYRDENRCRTDECRENRDRVNNEVSTLIEEIRIKTGVQEQKRINQSTIKKNLEIAEQEKRKAEKARDLELKKLLTTEAGQQYNRTLKAYEEALKNNHGEIELSKQQYQTALNTLRATTEYKAKFEPKEREFLYWNLRSFGLDKMNHYAIQRTQESSVTAIYSGLNSALHIDIRCGNDSLFHEVRDLVENELCELIEAERIKAGIEKEEPQILIQLVDNPS